MKKPIFIFFIVLLLTIMACNMPVETIWSETPTVSGTVDPIPSTSPTSTPEIGTPPAITPTAEALGEVPTVATSAVSQRVMPEGVVNIMLLGSDYRENSGYRTDVMMLVSVNTVKQSVSVISFPRDLYVPIPGWETQRLNTAMPHGGFKMLADTLEVNFGVRPDYYVLTDFNGFKSIIDGLGGVQVYAGSRLVDRCDLPIAVNGICTIEPGLVTMDGETALWYVRSRYSSSDLDRLRREQEVMTGIFTKLMSGGAAANLPSLYNRYKSSVKTNLTIQAITPLLPTALNVFANRKQISRYTMTVKEAKPYVTSTGAQVLLPDYDAINQMLDEAIFNP